MLGGLLGQSASAQTADKPIRIGWSEQPPYQMADASNNPVGFDLVLLTTVLHEMGSPYRVEHVQGSWPQQLDSIEGGRIDVIGGASRTPEREHYALFSAPYRQEKVALFVRYGESPQLALSSLHDIVGPDFHGLGVGSGIYYGADFEKWRREPAFAAKLEEYARDELAIDMLLQHHVDGVLLEVDFGTSYLRQEKLLGTRVERHPLSPMLTGGIQYMFSRKTINEAFVKRFNDQLAKVRNDGEYEDIARRYHR